MTTKAEKQHLDQVAQIPCIVCGNWPVHVHHAETGFGGQRDHMKVLPLCPNHHTGVQGIHTLGRKKWQARYGDEADLLKKTQQLIGEPQ